MSRYRPTESELSSFCEGMYRMYNLSRPTDPELVIFPLRGAHPFSVAYQKIAELNGEAIPHFLLLPLGTFTDVNLKAERGLTKPEKVEVVEVGLRGYFADHPLTRRVLLIDEVMNGGTILTHHSFISKYFQRNQPDAELRACAIEHGGRTQNGRYRNQVARRCFNIVRVESLFTMDREQYLPRVRRNGDFPVEIEGGKLEEIMERIERMYYSPIPLQSI